MKILTIVLSLFMATTVFADTLPNKKAVKQLAASVMEKVIEGKISEGVELTRPYIIIPTSELDVLKNQIKMQIPMIEQRFGKTVGLELVNIEEVGDYLMLILYVQKLEKHVMRWKFYFYKPNDEWVLNTFNFDDKLQLLFDDKF